MTEEHLLTAVLKLARLLGVTTAHFRPALSQSGRWHTAVAGDGKGFPDLVLAGPGGVLFRELKSATGRLAPEQVAWIGTLNRASADIAVWKPVDLESGRIERELRSIAAHVAAAKPEWMK
jgi:hypothetical protein